MISTKQRTIALSFIALATVFVLFAAGPLVTHEAQAYWGGGWHWPSLVGLASWLGSGWLVANN